MCCRKEDVVPVFVCSVIDTTCVEKPLGTEILLLGAVSGVVAGVQGALGESLRLLDSFLLCISAHISLCKLLSTGLWCATHKMLFV